MVNLADLTGTSYPEANTWVLLLFIPGLLGLLLIVRLGQRHRFGHLQRRIAFLRSSQPSADAG